MPPGTSWTQPEGGLFVWLTLPPGLRDDAVFEASLARGVAVVPGNGFFVGAEDPLYHACLRLNFSNQRPSAIEHGVSVLAAAIKGLRVAA